MRELSLSNCRIDKRYDVVELLGRGSYAEIFVARDTLAAPHSVHSQVVIKALNVFLQDDLDADLERTLVENFQNEAIALDRVRHPNVISRLGHGSARDLAGTVVQVGVPTPDMKMPDLPMIEFFGRGGALKPSWYGDCLPSRDFPMLIDLYLQGRFDLDRFVSETIALDQVEDAFHKMERGEVLRSVVVL